MSELTKVSVCWEAGNLCEVKKEVMARAKVLMGVQLRAFNNKGTWPTGFVGLELWSGYYVLVEYRFNGKNHFSITNVDAILYA